MNISTKKPKLYFLIFFAFQLNLIFLTAQEDDFRCLQGLKTSLSDPQSQLTTWSFTNTSLGTICKFNGVSCWNAQENRLIGLQLPSMKLKGQVPESLKYCKSLQSLDLSDNGFYGKIPAQICDWLPYLVSLDLSNNGFSGSIPSQLVNCKYLNTLNLKDNKLTGSIPYELATLNRLKKLSVANNDLSGQIPSFLSTFDSNDFNGNRRLCGRPLGYKCGGKKNLVIVVVAGCFGSLLSIMLALALWWWLFVRMGNRRKKRRESGSGKKDDGSGWIERLRDLKLVQVSLFQKPLVKIKLGDLIAATNNFDPEKIILSTRTGTSYKAILHDGSALSIKRLHNCKLNEKQFRSEMNRLGQIRHPNLVPLLGFCIVEEEKLLVYKHMPNGSLYSKLYGNGYTTSTLNGSLDWVTRLKIGIGSARGLAWLHHGCQPPFLHQNISSNVILLNDDFDARITDSGMARLMSSANSRDSTFVNGDFGEFGYIAPEYSSTMVASLKGDVYGFGVVLLELVTGQRPLEVTNAEEGFKGNLVDWVNQLSSSGRVKEVIDKSIYGTGHEEEILQFLGVACMCVVSRPKDRPSMYQVYQSLRTIGGSHNFSEQFDEFPLIYGKQEVDNQSNFMNKKLGTRDVTL
ncbi:Receptor-like kinase [Thalictrum thalictroides]|uniref:Receptor-like kinase n=1 Tax=Thalictrum thalictroides TaxID=46969 RepID=A0A7J6VN46_THATH|nr:Receptor-like kinase [Thalictrum thalictroides]